MVGTDMQRTNSNAADGVVIWLQGFPFDLEGVRGSRELYKFWAGEGAGQSKVLEGSPGSGVPPGMIDDWNKWLAACCDRFLSALDIGFHQLFWEHF